MPGNEWGYSGGKSWHSPVTEPVVGRELLLAATPCALLDSRQNTTMLVTERAAETAVSVPVRSTCQQRGNEEFHVVYWTVRYIYRRLSYEGIKIGIVTWSYLRLSIVWIGLSQYQTLCKLLSSDSSRAIDRQLHG